MYKCYTNGLCLLGSSYCLLTLQKSTSTSLVKMFYCSTLFGYLYYGSTAIKNVHLCKWLILIAILIVIVIIVVLCVVLCQPLTCIFFNRPAIILCLFIWTDESCLVTMPEKQVHGRMLIVNHLVSPGSGEENVVISILTLPSNRYPACVNSA